MNLVDLASDRSTICVIGRHGFIGSAIARNYGQVSATPTDDTRIIFHFGSYTHGEFDKNPRFHQARMFADLNFLLPYCKERDITFVYPSSALVYEGESEFGKFKRVVERMVGDSGVTAVGLRIFPTYGPGETRSVISQWCHAMLRGRRPIVYGDGMQYRDFIYIDDVVKQILALCTAARRGDHLVSDIGTSRRTYFKDVIDEINRVLLTGLQPVYVPQPAGYRHEGVLCKRPLQDTFTTVATGIRRILFGPTAA